MTAPRTREELLNLMTDAILADAYADGAIVSELSRQYCREGAQASLSIIERHCWIAPNEPTEPMLRAGWTAYWGAPGSKPSEVFRAMRNRAPFGPESRIEPPQDTTDEGPRG